MKLKIDLEFDFKRLLCLIGLHNWAYNGGYWHRVLKAEYSGHELKLMNNCGTTWPMLAFKLCTRCGLVKAQLRGRDDNGEFKGDMGRREYLR